MRTPQQFEMEIEEKIGASIVWRWNCNRSCVLNVSRRRDREQYRVSIHEMFLDAPDSLFPHIAAFIHNKPSTETRKAIRDFTKNHSQESSVRPVEINEVIRPQGRHYNLASIAREISNQYFKGELKPRITWGRKSKGKARARSHSSIQLGSCLSEHNLIRIHPILDNTEIPEFFIRYVIFHEMLHIICPPRRLPSGRVVYHSAEFRRLERRFKEWSQANNWEKANLSRLLSVRKNG